jgi:Flp pilus assembly protein TadD
VAFLPALSAGFVTWADNENFLNNPNYRGLGWPQLRWMWTTFHMGHYVPLTWMTLGFDYTLGGMNPRVYHLHNVVLHALNAMLVYALALRILSLARSDATEPSERSLMIPAAVTALVFAIHPLRVESVAWITERRDVLSMFFSLVCLSSYLRHVERGARVDRWYALSLAAFVCALLSKATSVSVPAVLLILNVYPLRRLGGRTGFRGSTARRVYAELVPFAVTSIAIAALSVLALSPPAQLTVGAKLAVSAYSLAFYLMKTIVPTHLSPLYEMPRTVNPVAFRYVASGVVVVTITVAAWMARRRYPGVLAAWFAFLVIVGPMLGIVQNGPQIAADRYTYHAAPALAILAGAAVARWRWPSTTVRALVVGVPLAALGVLTWHQTLVWHDSARLWTRVLSVDPASSVAEIAVGDLLIAQGRLDEAVPHYRRGVVLDPTFAGGFNNLGVLLARRGETADAITQYAEAVRLNPSFADAHNNWGIALSQQGQYDAAITHFEKAIRLDSLNPDAEVNLGNALVRQGQPDVAIPHYERAAMLRPGDVDAFLNWGVALAKLGRIPDAIVQFQRVLAIKPDHVEARSYLERAERLHAAPHPAPEK